MKQIIYARIRIEIESELPRQEAIDKFQQETYYVFESVEDVTVIDTDFLEIENDYEYEQD